MRMSNLGILLFLFLMSCSSSKVAEENGNSVINNLLDNWHSNVAKADFDSYFDVIASTGVYIGTDASEVWSKSEFQSFSRPYFDKKTTWDFKPLKRNVYFSENKKIAWFDELLDTWMGTCRGSGVLEKKEGKWLIKHYVLSVTIPNDDIRKVIQIKKDAK